jgi:hypothetical protein
MYTKYRFPRWSVWNRELVSRRTWLDRGGETTLVCWLAGRLASVHVPVPEWCGGQMMGLDSEDSLTIERRGFRNKTQPRQEQWTSRS